jgi:uncharacterized protein
MNMNYRFSKLASINDEDSHIVIGAPIVSSDIKLFEPSYLKEFRILYKRGGTENITSELECALYDNMVLIDSNKDEAACLEKAIREMDMKAYGLIILPTEDCNLRCVYCYEKFNTWELSQAHYAVLENEYKRVLEQGRKTVSLSWFGGEPLLKLEDITRFSRRIKDLTTEKGAQFSCSITTNGVLLDTTTLVALYNNGVTGYQITLDGYAHDNQRIYADGTGSFDAIFNNIRSMLESDLELVLVIRVNIADTNFNFAFYDLFLPFKDDKRLAFHIKSIGRFGGDFDLPVLESGAYANRVLNRHKEHLHKLGFTLSEDTVKGLQSGACYAGRENIFVVRANGKICKCTIALDDEDNDVGYLDLEKGEMVIDWNKEDLWSYNPLSLNCHKCKKLVACCNRSCPLNKKNSKSGRCCG